MINLSMIASEILRHRRHEAENFEDLSLFHAPGECFDLVRARLAREEQEILQRWGVTPTEYNAEVSARIDGKRAYQLGLLVDDPSA
jgi:hypothetical protein